MCGIIGYCGHRPAVPLVLEGLKRLEYRGYDSAGLAFLQLNKLEVIRSEGKLCNLEEKVAKTANTFAPISIGHTRWATHGLPVERNSHPHKSNNDALAIVHNGIIENFQEIKDELIQKGYVFHSDTDTEVLVNLVADELDSVLQINFGKKYVEIQQDMDEAFQKNPELYLPFLEQAFCSALQKAHGAYAVVVLSPLIPQHILAARLSAPLLLGIGIGEYFVASDVPAFLPYTRDVVFLDDREYVVLSAGAYAVKNIFTAEKLEKTVHHIPWDLQGAAKDGYKHFMLKEIMEQPKVLRDCLVGRLQNDRVCLPELDGLPVPGSIRIIACGTSYNAGLWSQYYLEQFAEIPVIVEIASEFRYRKPILKADELIVVISQSGETADTLGALRLCKEKGYPVVGICNVLGSSVAREASACLYTQAGPEISVASTKAMLSQMVLLLLLALYYGQRKNADCSHAKKLRAGILNELKALPEILEGALPVMRDKAKKFAYQYAYAKSFFYLGRGTAYSLALEGALKLKELSYIHAEGYATGEIKHGPIALIDPDFPTFALAFDDENFNKVCSGILEIKSRQGNVIALLQEGTELENNDLWYIPQTKLPEFLALPAMQLFSYEMADYLGKDVDQPRNLAKSVTVE